MDKGVQRNAANRESIRDVHDREGMEGEKMCKPFLQCAFYMNRTL